MKSSTALQTLLALAASIPLASPAAVAPNVLDIIRSNPDISIVRKVVERDPYLVHLYKNLHDATVFAPLDSSFPPPLNDFNNEFYDDIGLLRNIAQGIIAEGVFPASAIKPTPKYVDTKLTNKTKVNTSRGKAILELYEDDEGAKRVDSYSNTTSTVVTPNIKFKGGLLHKVAIPLQAPETISASAKTVPNYAIGNLSALGLLEKLDKKKDVTLFSITNEAWEDLVASGCEHSHYMDVLDYYVVEHGVYYGNKFDGRGVKTLEGASVKLTSSNSGRKLKVNGIKVASPDVFVKNGVYHILEKPLEPPK